MANKLWEVYNPFAASIRNPVARGVAAETATATARIPLVDAHTGMIDVHQGEDLTPAQLEALNGVPEEHWLELIDWQPTEWGRRMCNRGNN